jgi:AmiR/NasT family two-component response regulator
VAPDRRGTIAAGMRKLRVLITDGLASRQREVTSAVTSLGHEVVGSEPSLDGDHPTSSGPPDVALVIVGEDSDEALDLIRTTVRDAAWPVIAILDVADRALIARAARLGIFSAIAHAGDLEEMQGAMDIALQRFAEYHALEGAFGRRAVTERAKGILMERGSLDEQQAFHLLREQARRTNRKVVDVAGSILESHRLLSNGKESAALDDVLLVRTEDGG